MNRDTIIAVIDHLPTVVVYCGAGIGFVVALLTGRTEAAETLGALLAGAGIVQAKSAAANTLKKGGPG